MVKGYEMYRQHMPDRRPRHSYSLTALQMSPNPHSKLLV